MIASIMRTASGSLDTESYKNITGQITLDGLSVDVTILDARLAYGRLDFCVQPKSGGGSKWVSSSKVTLSSEPLPSSASVVSAVKKQTRTAPMFRQEVARRKAESTKGDAQETLAHIKSYMDKLITKKEENQ